MPSKLALLLTVVGAIAFVAPAPATAAPVTVSGESASVGLPFNAKSTNTIFTTSFGNVTCFETEMDWELTANTGVEFKGVGIGKGEGRFCFKGGGSFIVHDLTMGSLTSTTAGKGTMAVTFEIDWPFTTAECHYASPAAGLPFTYNAGSNVLTVKGSLVAKPLGCGAMIVHGDWSVTSTKGAVVLD